MATFSNTKKLYAATVTNKVLGDYDDPLPGIVAGASINNENIPNGIIKHFSDGFYSRSEKYYKYGRDHFVRGLPETGRQTYNVNTAEIKRIIESNLGKKIVLLGATVTSELDNAAYQMHYVNQFLQDIRLYNPVTKVVENPPPLDPNPWGQVILEGYTIDNTNYQAVFTYRYVNISNDPSTDDEILPLVLKEEYLYQVRYFELDNNGVTIQVPKYWSYVVGTGTYPILDALAQSAPEESDYYPIVPFYEDKFQVGDPANAGTPLYETSKRLVEKFGFNYKEIVDSLAEGTAESIGKDKGLYCYMYLGAEATAGIPSNYLTATADEWKVKQDSAQATIDYLINFFIDRSPNMLFNEVDLDNYRATYLRNYEPRKNTIYIQDESFKMYLSFAYIKVETITGVIGKPGRCSSQFVSELIPVHYGVNELGEPVSSTTADVSRMIYRRQETLTTYVEVTVAGLDQKFTVFENKDAFVNISRAFRIDPDERNIITIPLDRSIVKQGQFILKNRLMHASLCFVFNAYIFAEVKWYQDGFWVFVAYVIALILTIPTGGQSLSWAALLTRAGLIAAAKALLIAILKYILFRELVKLIAKEFGVELAFVLSVVFMAYGKFVKTPGMLPGTPFAMDFTTIGSSIWAAANKNINQQLETVQGNYVKFLTESEKMQVELDRAKELLRTENSLDPMLFIHGTTDLILGEGANEFIDIRIHQSNLGVKTLDSAHVYHDLMLTLPTINDTIQ